MRATGKSGRWWMAVLAAGGLCGAAVAVAAGLRLPADYPFPQGDGSPGQVTFSHTTHVGVSAPSCVTCHPAGFAMLKPGTASGLPALQHAAMEKGQACGACHGKQACGACSGKQAFGFESCELCHK